METEVWAAGSGAQRGGAAASSARERSPAVSSARARGGGAAAARAQRGGAAAARTQRGGAAAARAQRGGAAAARPLPEPRGEELPLPEPRGEKPPLPEPRGEAKSRPPPQPRPPPLKTSPATDGAVPCPDVVVPLPECQDLPLLVLTPGSQYCQAQLLSWSPTPLLLDLQTSRREGQALHALPLFFTLFPLKLQASLRGSTVAHLCQSLLAPGCRPALQSPSSSRPGSPSLVRGPFQEMPEGLTHPQARPQEGAKIDICGLEGTGKFGKQKLLQ
ncbi:UNVERIFIED_CONTAM: hypothetical protein FKN15_066742 [Acipenser sinensis]